MPSCDDRRFGKVSTHQGIHVSLGSKIAENEIMWPEKMEEPRHPHPLPNQHPQVLPRDAIDTRYREADPREVRQGHSSETPEKGLTIQSSHKVISKSKPKDELD